MIYLFGFLAFVLVFVGYAYLNFRKMKRFTQLPDSGKIRHLSEKNFKKAVNKGVVLVDFWAEWCMPCKMMTPILNDLSESVNGETVIAKVDVDKNQLLATRHGIRSIPTLVLFKDGKELDRFQGVKTKKFLAKKIEEVNKRD